MKMNQTILTSAALAAASLLAGNVFAQEEAEAPEDEELAAEEAPEEEGEEVAQMEEEAPVEEAEPVEEEPAPEPMEEEPEPVEPEPVAAEPMVEEAAEVEEEEEAGGSPFLFVFADAYAAFQTSKSGVNTLDDMGEPIGTGGGVYSSVGPDGTPQSGFGINWLGVDLGYDAEKWGVTGSIRFGDGVYQYGVGTLGAGGVGITNAYATWKPVDTLAIDMGIFGTIYGAEVAESWQNLNYTRGELYFNYQPFWHTGLRVEWAPGNFVARALVVNDPNTSTLEDGAINGGLQAGWDNGTFGIVAGALQSFAPETSADSKVGGFLDTFFDVVVTVNAGGFSLIGNFDANLGYAGEEGVDDVAGFWGASLAAGYAFTPAFGVALRGEYLASNDGALFGTDEDSLITGTLTIDTKPVPGVENFVVRWDNRIEFASEDVYTNMDADDVTGSWFSSTLGVVGYADLL